ncbi:hypothetical protein GEV33_011865 [Tenebrio molitor]|uniref:Uncharacterized protein n=1 Tax=Tenebrio molitor TaxID=7067 RepID=A0A8J6HAW3_TENMO|nr:hypothetical protein GEV33_011865 [Tenebrio molitor]
MLRLARPCRPRPRPQPLCRTFGLRQAVCVFKCIDFRRRSPQPPPEAVAARREKMTMTVASGVGEGVTRTPPPAAGWYGPWSRSGPRLAAFKPPPPAFRRIVEEFHAHHHGLHQSAASCHLQQGHQSHRRRPEGAQIENNATITGGFGGRRGWSGATADGRDKNYNGMMVGDANVNTVKSELKSSRVGLLWIHFKGVADEIRRLLIAFKRRKNIGHELLRHSFDQILPFPEQKKKSRRNPLLFVSINVKIVKCQHNPRSVFRKASRKFVAIQNKLAQSCAKLLSGVQVLRFLNAPHDGCWQELYDLYCSLIPVPWRAQKNAKTIAKAAFLPDLILPGQQQQFHFAFGQRPFPFAASDPLSGFRMPPIGNCNNMPQFGLSSTNSHWGYGAAGAYSPYFTPSTLGSCAAPTASQFNTPALGFSGSTPDQSSTQDAFGSTSNVSSLLPDSSATDLDQHLGLVSSQNHTNHSQSTTHTSSLLVPRYSSNHTDFALSGPRSLSDNSSAAESPVQEDILTTQTSLGVNHVNNTNFPLHQNMTSSSYPSSNCNNSIYPVLPASLLYSQLYSAANQSHNFHSLHSHTSQAHHNDLQSVMDQLSTTNQRQMNGTTDLLLSNNGTCAAAAARQEDGRLTTNGGQRGPGQNSDAVVWRPSERNVTDLRPIRYGGYVTGKLCNWVCVQFPRKLAVDFVLALSLLYKFSIAPSKGQRRSSIHLQTAPFKETAKFLISTEVVFLEAPPAHSGARSANSTRFPRFSYSAFLEKSAEKLPIKPRTDTIVSLRQFPICNINLRRLAQQQTISISCNQQYSSTNIFDENSTDRKKIESSRADLGVFTRRRQEGIS